MKLLLDMNLPPGWARTLQRSAGAEVLHWSQIGSPNAPDADILHHARQHGFVVVTHDLDFPRLLALTHASGPSVILIRAQDLIAAPIAAAVAHVTNRYRSALGDGALVVIETTGERVRILPLF